MLIHLMDRLDRLRDRRRIAVIPIRGVLGGAVKTSDLIRIIDRARTTPRIHAVMLDIDCPGGGATASEALYFAVKRLAADKPVVAWIRGTGASGAYFLACGATRVLAFPSAIVGSIGVISVRPVATEALRRAGIAIIATTTGPFKDLGAPWRDPTDEDRKKEQGLVDSVFQRFTSVVREARGYDDAALARVTTGEVWLGEQAVEIGLVDAVCVTEDEALITAQRLAGLPRVQPLVMRGKRGVLQRIGVPGAGMGPPGPRWIAEFEGWLRKPTLRL